MILMCNKGIAESSIDQQHRHGSVFLMDGNSSASNYPMAAGGGGGGGGGEASPVSIDEIETPRVKFLCSFSGSILPRPQDGKLRYVGGDTRIVSVPRDIGFDELMAKMRELYDGAAVLKYQQPDEDLDALVSVVNDEDVVNMMEEYDKLGSAGDGFTRLRIFLFSQPENDVLSHYDGDERETERRYVDALNNLNDGLDFRPVRQFQPESPVMGDDLHAAVAEHYFNSLSLETMMPPQYNLRRLSIPHVGSGQHLPMMGQRYSDAEAPWSPAYYSPRHHVHEMRPAMAEFPSSPSSARFHVASGDLPADRFLDQQMNQQQPPLEPQSQYPENIAAWMQSGALAGDKSGFPSGSLFHGQNAGEGSSICEHCRMAFHRNFDHPSVGNGIHQAHNPLCADCPPSRDSFLLNAEAKLHQGLYPNEQSSDHRSMYNEALGHERGWILQQQLNARADEARASVSGSLRTSDHYPVDGVGVNLPHGHGSVADCRPMSSNYLPHRAGYEIGNEIFHDQTTVGLPHFHVPSSEESGVRYGNLPFPLVGENIYPTHGYVPGHPLWRNVQNPAHVGQSYEAGNPLTQGSGKLNPGLPRSQWDGSPRLCVGMENQIPRFESSKLLPFEGKTMPEYSYGHTSRVNSTTAVHEHQPYLPDPIQVSPDIVKLASGVESAKEAAKSDEKSMTEEEKEANDAEKYGTSDTHDVSSLDVKTVGDKDGDILSSESINSSCVKPGEEDADVLKQVELDYSAPEDPDFVEKLSFLPEMIASAKKAALDGANDMKVKVEEDSDAEKNGFRAQEQANEVEPAIAHADTELDSDSDNINTSRIEPTKAEEEAFDKGLQTIMNDDLEEIRELGSGTYGAVYHGKWRGSDVAIKRIKASCFAGRPSERERLIADFWKEALILSSLHHPNVVSFYGIVRDGPDGSLATVTEFMVNGSLKQFLQKKDRTIDRRKRLIIAMDAAFGMEYLHGKNIVHFDLKCENLLVNMRDPQRPVCKIGDLGLSKVKQHTLVSGGVRGTLPWMAPELLSGKSNMVTEKIDVYSFGIVMWELLTGEEPYADLHCASIIGGIVNNTLRPQIPTWCDPEWKSLMESSWASDPAQRPSFSEISQKLRNMAAAMNLK